MQRQDLVERMAKAAWNLKASVPWDEHFTAHPEFRQMYLDQAEAALAVVEDLRNLDFANIFADRFGDTCSE